MTSSMSEALLATKVPSMNSLPDRARKVSMAFKGGSSQHRGVAFFGQNVTKYKTVKRLGFPLALTRLADLRIWRSA
jgi:hypothetical protein